MPRPDRIRQRETARAGAIDAADPPANEAIDNGGQSSQSVTTQEDEASPELVVSRTVARRMGWVPKEEWKRDPAKWVEADQYLENTPTEIAALKDDRRRMGNVAEAMAEEARQRGIREAEDRLKQATEKGDTDGAVAAARQMQGPPPQTVAWLTRNPWFNSDLDAQALAAAAMLRAQNSGGGIETQLAAGEDAVRKRFPEHFGVVARIEPQETETRLSETRMTPPQVQGGSRGGTQQRPKEKGWGDLPSAARSQMAKAVQRAVRNHGKTEAEAQSFIARAYWSEQAA